MRKLSPDNEWTWNEVLLNKIEYAMRVLIWQNTADGHSKSPMYTPEMFLPSFIPKKKKKTEETAMDLDDVKAFLSRPRESAKV